MQEEIRLRGIAPCVYNIKPTIGFVVDVGFATDVPGSSQYEESTFCLGKGVGLIHNADNNPILVDYLKTSSRVKENSYTGNSRTHIIRRYRCHDLTIDS